MSEYKTVTTLENIESDDMIDVVTKLHNPIKYIPENDREYCEKFYQILKKQKEAIKSPGHFEKVKNWFSKKIN